MEESILERKEGQLSLKRGQLGRNNVQVALSIGDPYREQEEGTLLVSVPCLML